MRPLAACGLACFIALLAGCKAKEFNPHVSTESEILENPMQLTHGFDKAGEAYFSPDMSWIIVQACPSGEPRYQMYVAPVKWSFIDEPMPPGPKRYNTPLPGGLTMPRQDNILGIGRPVRISPENSRNTCGFFSPDGNSLIFGSTAGKEDPGEPTSGYQRSGHEYRWSFPPGMEIYRADGWQGAIAAAEPNAIVNLAQHALTDNYGYDAECAFSPDGKWIVFCSNRAGAGGEGQGASETTQPTGDLELYAMRSDGSHVVRLTHSSGYDGGPFFSPDGKRIVYRSDRKGNNLLQIFVADLVFDHAGEITGICNERQLTHDANVNWGPFWHPDGKHIVYATSMHGHANYELYLMRADGSRKTRVTFTQGFDGLPAFSPDGRYLMWTSTRGPEHTSQIWVAKFKMAEGS